MNDTNPLPTTPIETHSDRPRRPFSARPVLIGAGAALAVLTLGVGGFAFADTLNGANDDRIIINSSPSSSPSPIGDLSDDPDGLTPSDAEYADVTAAALAAVGGGTVTEVKRGDSPGDAAWKVEITLANGDVAEVRLDANLNVIRVDLDNDTSGDDTSDDSGTDDSGTDDSGTDNSSDDSGADDSGSDTSGDDTSDSGSDVSGSDDD